MITVRCLYHVSSGVIARPLAKFDGPSKRMYSTFLALGLIIEIIADYTVYTVWPIVTSLICM